MMLRFILVIFLACHLALEASYTAEDFVIDHYSEIAICTDLEPDDVLALKIIFNYVNQHYSAENYPIKLIVVGEGNPAIKKLRMQEMLTQYFHVPRGVTIEIAEGHSSSDNLYPYDGMELFSMGELPTTLPILPSQEQGGDISQGFCQVREIPPYYPADACR